MLLHTGPFGKHSPRSTFDNGRTKAPGNLLDYLLYRDKHHDRIEFKLSCAITPICKNSCAFCTVLHIPQQLCGQHLRCFTPFPTSSAQVCLQFIYRTFIQEIPTRAIHRREQLALAVFSPFSFPGTGRGASGLAAAQGAAAQVRYASYFSVCVPCCYCLRAL